MQRYVILTLTLVALVLRGESAVRVVTSTSRCGRSCAEGGGEKVTVSSS